MEHQSLPAGIRQCLDELEAIASLLACADPVKWDSLGRPTAAALSALVRGAHSSLEDELAAHFDLAGPPA